VRSLKLEVGKDVSDIQTLTSNFRAALPLFLFPASDILLPTSKIAGSFAAPDAVTRGSIMVASLESSLPLDILDIAG
jgi:hypothetical protein